MAKDDAMTPAQEWRLMKSGYKRKDLRGWTRGKAGYTISTLPEMKKEEPSQEVVKTNMPQVQAIRALGRYVVHCPYCGLDHSHSGVGLQQSGCENGALPYWVEGGEL